MTDPAGFLRALFDAAVAAADPMRALAPRLPRRPSGRTLVLAAGKAAGRMAEAVEAEWGPCEGIALSRYGHGRPLRGIEGAEGAHPVPDAAGAAATRRMLEAADGLGEGDLLLFLVSGGASALLTAPRAPLTLGDMAAVNEALLASGLAIGEMNLVRRQLDAAKGGHLAARAHPARTVTLAISDVPGDDPALIGSGPTVPGLAPDGALGRLADRLRLGPAADALLRGPQRALAAGDPRGALAETRVVIAPALSLAAAARMARAAGVRVIDLGDRIEGEAREIARAHAAAALGTRSDGPVLLLSGGELTVTRAPGADGVGGPNAEYALALALALDGAPGIHAIACDTDGVDGAAEVAGALIGPDTPLDGAAEALARHDAHGFFGRAGGQVVTGPTLTNVNDFRAILVLP
ncbi:MAG: glycerate kinase type-2 family protein [Hasllibacter sp.]